MASRIFLIIALFGVSLFACKDEKPAPDAGGAAIDAGVCPGTGPTAFLETCTDNDECSTCVCKLVGHEKICTKECDGPADCPAPSGGCTMGFCTP